VRQVERLAEVSPGSEADVSHRRSPSRFEDPVCDLVERPVPAKRHDQLGSRLCGVPRELDGMRRALGPRNLHSAEAPSDDGEQLAQSCLASPPARARIHDDRSGLTHQKRLRFAVLQQVPERPEARRPHG
jgi:hypothetical protein